MLHNIYRDALLALRSLRKDPILSLTAILTLALGIGANTAISAHCVSSANVQELSEASDQPIQKPDLALKGSLSGTAQ
jgi:hypothetical protein